MSEDSDKYSAKKIHSESNIKEFSWNGPEFIYHEKNFKWYTYLVLVTSALVAVLVMFTKDIISAILAVLLASIFGVYANKKPATVKISVNKKGVEIANKTTYYESFKSYSVLDFEEYSCVTFMPVKRFSVLLSIYFKTEDKDKIIAVFENKLPLDNRKEDFIDRATRVIGF